MSDEREAYGTGKHPPYCTCVDCTARRRGVSPPDRPPPKSGEGWAICRYCLNSGRDLQVSDAPIVDPPYTACPWCRGPLQATVHANGHDGQAPVYSVVCADHGVIAPRVRLDNALRLARDPSCEKLTLAERAERERHRRPPKSAERPTAASPRPPPQPPREPTEAPPRPPPGKPARPPAASPKPPKSGCAPRAAIALLVLVAAIGAVAYFGGFLDSNDPPPAEVIVVTATPTPDPTPTAHNRPGLPDAHALARAYGVADAHGHAGRAYADTHGVAVTRCGRRRRKPFMRHWRHTIRRRREMSGRRHSRSVRGCSSCGGACVRGVARAAHADASCHRPPHRPQGRRRPRLPLRRDRPLRLHRGQRATPTPRPTATPTPRPTATPTPRPTATPTPRPTATHAYRPAPASRDSRRLRCRRCASLRLISSTTIVPPTACRP